MNLKKLSVATLAVVTGFAAHAQDSKDSTKKDTTKSFVAVYQDTTKKDTAKSFVAFYQDTTKKDTTKKDTGFKTLAMNLNAVRLYNSFVSLPENNEAKDENEYTNGIKEDEITS